MEGDRFLRQETIIGEVSGAFAEKIGKDDPAVEELFFTIYNAISSGSTGEYNPDELSTQLRDNPILQTLMGYI